jgi:hypothetical protein
MGQLGEVQRVAEDGISWLDLGFVAVYGMATEESAVVAIVTVCVAMVIPSARDISKRSGRLMVAG